MNKNKEIIFFVYGTLKRGHYNHSVLGKPEYLGEFKTESKYTLFDGGYPIVERGGNTSIKGELFKLIDERDIQNIFNLEGCYSQIQGDKDNWYDFDYINTPHGKAIIFVMNKDKSQRINKIESGIWK